MHRHRKRGESSNPFSRDPKGSAFTEFVFPTSKEMGHPSGFETVDSFISTASAT